MLVLTRKVGERVQIGEQICVTVVRIADGTVRIGIEAPSDAVVVRSELLPPEGPLPSAVQPPQLSAPYGPKTTPGE
jgi:carbon storage regulator